MPGGEYQVIDVLLLVGNVAPVALYFLALGLVNSHARPYLISSRADFVALTCVLVPVLLWPAPVFLPTGTWWPLAAGLCLLATVFFWMLPKRDAGYVVYNISVSQCTRLLGRSLRSLGINGQWRGTTWRDEAGTITIVVRSFPLLRNVTLHIETTDAKAARSISRLGGALQERLTLVAQLPSATGAGLVLIGLTLMILPIWMVGRHIDDLVDAMTHLFG